MVGTEPASDLRLKLVWLTLFRTVATSLLLAVNAVRLWPMHGTTELSREDSSSFLAIACVYLLTLVYGVLLRQERVGAAVAYVQVLGDVVLASALVYLTGGAESPFTFTYSLAVVAGSILLLQKGALIAASASTLSFALLTVAIQVGWLRPPLGGAALGMERVTFLLVSNGLAQFLIAVLAGYLSHQLSAAGGKLSAREEDLKKLADLHHQILTCMPSGLITAEANGRVTFINRAAAAILELPDTQEPRYVEQLIPGVLSLGVDARRQEIDVQTSAGHRCLGLTITPLEGKERSLLIVFQDLTDLRRMEDALRRSDQLAALGKLAAQLAHEIRNPLAAMRGSAQMLVQDAPANATAVRLTGILIRESDRLSALLEDFLRFARPPPPQRRRSSLKQLVAETVEMLRADPQARGLQIDLNLGELPSYAEVDTDQIRQVLINLLRNAFAAVAPHGRVRVSLQAGERGPQVHIWDSAGSIPSADLPRVFEPFFTTREGGTGLGLSTTHSIVRAHGGTIRVSSSRSEGTEFVVELPAEAEVTVADSSR